ncbi:MAG: UvrD-helicase domain-containing protein [Nitrospiraceae bacterium]|nr:UvrD-helicase domain-containing protein [Nitrospiraceae bacterium]
MTGYFDTKKSFIISSPAGSGKTEKLARRYISLIAAGFEVERVLAITFTEKAASEMKQRILKILAGENPDLYAKIRPRVPLMRISTIHSFCLKLLRRFHLELGLDPGLKVADEAASASLTLDSIMDVLKGEQEEPGLFFALMKERGIRGWDGLLAHLTDLFRLRPLSELILEEPLDLREGRESMLLQLFIRCLAAYRAKKDEARLLDFSDLELLAYKALLKSPHWQNILYSFDEYTDHILVDEFQDTSALQWRILDKLTEEWRSGLGAKRDAGAVPTFFLVGDEKQSIYLFRGADVTVMKKARQRLQNFLGPEYEFHQARDNFRSLPAIIEFTNRLFEKLMAGANQFADQSASQTGTKNSGNGVEEFGAGPTQAGPWQVDYSPFEAKRQGEGKVELLLLDEPLGTSPGGTSPGGTNPSGGRTKDKRAVEALALAKLIKTMRRNFAISCEVNAGARPCEYSDMAVLLRQRTHLAAFEEAFRGAGVPFLVVKGMGFYDEPEVALLREFASFIARPEDDYSLFCLLRSPLFGMGYEGLRRLRAKGTPLIEALRARGNRSKKYRQAAEMLDGFVASGRRLPLSRLIELMLVKTGTWQHFWEPPRHANVKKFIRMVESWESEGATLIEIRDKLLADRFRAEVPKANVNAEGMDVVKLMTVHAAKGLQFPILFLPSLDEDISPKSPPVVIEERISMGGKTAAAGEVPALLINDLAGFSFRYEPDSGERKKTPQFERNRIKELEEEKRLFYVAATRAMDCLILSGIRPANGKPKGRLNYLVEAFGSGILQKPEAGSHHGHAEDHHGLPFGISSGAELEENYEKAAGMEFSAGRHFLDGPLYAEPFEYDAAVKTKDVTEDILVKTRHGRDWVLMGRLMHQVLEEISAGRLRPAEAGRRVETILKELFVFGEARKEFFLKTVLGDIDAMDKQGILEEVVLPRQKLKAFSELSFVHHAGKTLYKGRIDRLLIKDGALHVYDYKSFPVRKRETGELVEKYRFQMELYREAAQDIFRLPARAFLIFTHIPEILEITPGAAPYPPLSQSSPY